MAGHVGIIGLGIMGSAYAKNLIAGGVKVSGSDPLPEAQARLTDMGGTAHASTGDWLKDCDVVILSLISPPVLHQVAEELAGILSPEQVVVETGTFALADKMAVHEILSKAGIPVLDCPVSGTGVQAAARDLVMMMSGPEAAIDKAEPFIRHMTKKIIRAGEFGAGTRLKFVANHAVALHNTAAAESLAYADALALDRHVVYDMLSNGAGQSKMSDLRIPLMIDGAYEPPTATLKMFEKDLSVIGDDIRRLGMSAPLFEACDALYAEARETLPETYDTAAVFEVYRAKKPE